MCVAVVAAVFLSNTPESISAAVGLRRAGGRPARILAMWVAVAAASGLAAALGLVTVAGFAVAYLLSTAS